MHHIDLPTIEKPLTLSVISTGVLYRNPIPHVRSSHAYFPSVVSMDNGERLATFALFNHAKDALCRIPDFGAIIISSGTPRVLADSLISRL